MMFQCVNACTETFGILDCLAAGSGILMAVLQHKVHVGGRSGMHRQDTVPQFVRMLSCRVCSSTACCSKYGCTARTCQENHPRTLRIQRHRNSVGPSFQPLWMHEQQACTSQRRERPRHQAVLCHTLSASFSLLAGVALRMLFHVLLRRMHVCSTSDTLRCCDSALQHVSNVLVMIRCCIGEVVSAARGATRTCRVRQAPGRSQVVRVVRAS